MRFTAFCSLVLLFQNPVCAQRPDDYSHLKELYPKHNYVFLDNTKNIEMNVEGDSLGIIATEKERIYFTDDRANLYKSKSVTASYFVKLNELNATTYYKKNNRYKKEKVKEFETKKTISKKYFYDDTETTTFEFPKLRKEGIAELETVKTVTSPYFGQSAYFADFSPVMKREVVLEVDHNIVPEISYFNMTADDVNYTVKEKRKTTVHTWRSDSIDAFKNEPGSPNPAYFIPHLIIRVKYYITEDGDTVNVLRNTGDLHKWYTRMIETSKCEDYTELKEVIDELILPEDDELLKVKKVFNSVREKIKYVAVEDGLGGFVPRPPDLVMKRRYGDCKDMSSLIVEMLKLLDIEAHIAWIGTRSIPYSYSEMPSPSADNHMIAVYQNPETGKFIYLDATDSYVPFGFPTQAIQGKEAMINAGDDNFLIDTVPVQKIELNYWRDTSYLQIQGDVITGSGTLDFTGYFANDYRHFLKGAHTGKKQRDHVKANTLKGNNKYSLNDYSIVKNDSSLRYTYDFDIKNYIHRINDEVYINLNLEKSFGSFTSDFEDREQNLESDYKKGYNLHYVLNLPPGYKADYLPEDESFEHPLFGYSVKYISEPDKITYNLDLRFNYISLEKEHFSEYESMVKSLKNTLNQSVLLKKEER